MTELDTESKASLWWQSTDFAEFMKVRVSMAKAYQEAVQQDRVETFCTDSMVRRESRRGLGLGRAKVRLNNTRAYINAILKEQARQHNVGQMDHEKLAMVGQAISTVDLQYSWSNAKRDEMESIEYRNESPPEEEQIVPDSNVCSGSLGMKRVESFGLFDKQHFRPDDDPPPESKGFGLSRDDLEQMGLRATGRRDEEAPNH